MRIYEYELRNYVRCPLLDIDEYLPEFEGAALELLQWTMLESMNGREIALKVLHRKFEWLYQSLLPEGQPREGKAYWAGIRNGRAAARRIHDFLRLYRVIKPIGFYVYSWNEVEIAGRYGVIEPRQTQQGVPLVLVVHTKIPYDREKPDMVELVRWLNEMSTCEYSSLDIYNLPIFAFRPWIHRPREESMAQNWIRSIMKALAQKQLYANSGRHCNDCVSKRCLEVWNG